MISSSSSLSLLLPAWPPLLSLLIVTVTTILGFSTTSIFCPCTVSLMPPLTQRFHEMRVQKFQSINQSNNLFVMKLSTCDIAVTAPTGTTRLKSAYGSPK